MIMNDLTIYMLLQSFVKWHYCENATIDVIEADIRTNDYFGEDTEVVLEQLTDVYNDL